MTVYLQPEQLYWNIQSVLHTRQVVFGGKHYLVKWKSKALVSGDGGSKAINGRLSGQLFHLFQRTAKNTDRMWLEDIM